MIGPWLRAIASGYSHPPRDDRGPLSVGGLGGTVRLSQTATGPSGERVDLRAEMTPAQAVALATRLLVEAGRQGR